MKNSAQHPINAYAASKRAIEDILRDFEIAHDMRHVIFRYFNVAGADPDAEVGEFHQPETHLIPLMLDAVDGRRDALTIFGTDYDTPDGTCIRDYVHVMDLVDAHVLGLKWLEDHKGSRVFNLGTGSGFSVREVIDQSACRDQPRGANRRRAAPTRRLHQAGVRLDPGRGRTGLAPQKIDDEPDDRRCLALASNWTLQQITPILPHEAQRYGR